MFEDAPPFLRGFRFQLSVALGEVARHGGGNRVGRGPRGLRPLFGYRGYPGLGPALRGAGRLARILDLRNTSQRPNRLEYLLRPDPRFAYPRLRAGRGHTKTEPRQHPIPIDDTATLRRAELVDSHLSQSD